MVRAIVYFFLGAIVLGTIAVPGLGAFALLVAPLALLGFIWRAALTVATRGHPSKAVALTRQRHFLGPGGPDDSFTAYDPGENEASQEASKAA